MEESESVFSVSKLGEEHLAATRSRPASSVVCARLLFAGHATMNTTLAKLCKIFHFYCTNIYVHVQLIQYILLFCCILQFFQIALSYVLEPKELYCDVFEWRQI